MNQPLNRYIDHTLLNPCATRAQICKLCEEALAYEFYAVCVNPVWIGLVSEMLSGSNTLPCTVIDFPLGASASAIKESQAAQCVALGARELDMVIHLGAAKAGEWDIVQNDIFHVVRAADGKAKVKVILETCLLDETEIQKACKAALLAGANFVKTSTGFSKSGANAKDVALMRATVGNAMGVKAAGGIRTLDDAVTFIAAGADRIGTSAGVAIMQA